MITSKCVEIFLEGEADIKSMLRRIPAYLEKAGKLVCKSSQKASPLSESEKNFTVEEVENLQNLCRESGWTCSPRPGGQLAANLDVGDAFQQAVFERTDEGLRLVSFLPSWNLPEEPTIKAMTEDPCLQALAVFLLLTGSRVRMVRPGLRLSGSGQPLVPFFDVVIGVSPGSADISQALGALSVASRFCLRESVLLKDKTLAEEYLGLLGWPKKQANG